MPVFSLTEKLFSYLPFTQLSLWHPFLVCTNTIERNIIHDCHHQYSSPHSPPGGRSDADRAWSAKTLWLVRWSWSHPVETGLRETGLQAGMVMGHPGNCRGSRRRSLRRVGLLDTPGCRRHPRGNGYCNLQEPLEKRFLAEQRRL